MFSKASFAIKGRDAALSAATDALESLGYSVEADDGFRVRAWESTDVTGPDPARTAVGDPRAPGSAFLGVEVLVDGDELALIRLTNGRRSGFVGADRVRKRFRQVRSAVRAALADAGQLAARR
ncbi:hypothetical protein [Pseudonocardia sp. MH-G8]|uniref:hypothetical protein n=1 Tax=Pseudonocardia sp. MH-G8 TaxID=1854588 RepID=UPI000BA0334A|nr:hypothetical protein [Pseudonocardia sp. MH-G8]OZM83560.1 hypothetical protein CFP66_03390 [Pseudonocardia sp. MH-G8]